MAEEHAGEGLDLDVRERCALREREAPDLLLGEADVVERLLGDGGDARRDLLSVKRKLPGDQPSSDSE